MSINPLNDISKVYLEQIAISEAKVDKLKPEHERATARDKRSEFSDLPGSGARRARRIAHRERDELNKDAKDIRRGKLNAPQFQGKTGQERIAQVKKAIGMKEEKKPNDGNLANNYPPYDKVTRGDVIAGRLGKDQMGGKKKVKEGFSNWREELSEIVEVIDKSKNDQKITEKQVNNKVVINPTLNLGDGVRESVEKFGGTLLEMVELDEEFIYETVNIATEYFYEMGLNEVGVDILVEELGLEGFVDFVFELSEEYTLTEAKFDRLPPVSKSGKNISSLKGGAKASAIKSKRQIRTTLRQKVDTESQSKPGFKSFSQKHDAVAKAKKQQPTKKPLKDRIAKGVLGAVKAYQQGMERHRAATATAGKALRVAGKGASEFGKGVASGVKTVGKVARDVRRVIGESEEIDEAKLESGESEATKKDIRSRRYVEKTKGAEGVRNYDAMGSTAPNWVTAARRRAHKAERGVKKEEFELNEKSESEQQQKLFGLALSVKRGDTPRSEVSDAVLKIVDTMSEKKIRDFAKTKHEGIPKKVEANEDLQPTTPQQFSAQRQLAMAQRKLTAADQIALQQKKKMVSGTVQKENTSDNALELVRQSIMKKHGAASLMGTPENKAASKAAAEKAKTQSKPKQKDPYPDDVYSRGIGIRGYRSGD